jgi:hypothetical protein
VHHPGIINTFDVFIWHVHNRGLFHCFGSILDVHFGHIIIFDGQTATDAATDTGQPFEKLDRIKFATFDFFQNVDDILNAINMEYVFVFQVVTFSAGQGPGTGFGGGIMNPFLDRTGADLTGNIAVNVFDGNGAINLVVLVILAGRRVINHGGFCCAGGDEKNPDIAVFIVPLFSDPFSDQSGRHRHRRF